MSTYKAIKEIESTSAASADSLGLIEKVSGVSGDIAMHLGVIPGVTFGYELGAGTSYTNVWSTIGTGIQSGERLDFDFAGTTISVASTSVNDTDGGSGAHNLFVRGLDASGNRQVLPVNLTGQAPAEVGVFIAVDGLFVGRTGSADPKTAYNEGTIRAGVAISAGGSWMNGVPASTWNVIAPEYSLSRCCFYAIPTGFGALPYHAWISTDAVSKTDDMRIRTLGYSSAFGSVVAYHGADVWVIGNGNPELRGTPISPGANIITKESRCGVQNGLDITCQESYAEVDLSLYPGAN